MPPRMLTTCDYIELKRLLFEDPQPSWVIAQQYNTNIRTVKKWRRNFRVYGEPYAPSIKPKGAPRLLTAEDEEVLRYYLEDWPCAYLDEIAFFVWDRFGVDASDSTVSRWLKKMNWSLVVAKKEAAQRDSELRAHWRAKRLYWRQRQLVFLDETASCPRTGDRKRGWSPRGLPCYDVQRLRRDKRWSVLPALTLDGYLRDPLIVEGSVLQEVFEQWFEDKLLPQLQPGQIVVMDNASIHNSEVIRELCLNAGVQLEYLPPYSPDYNPIEQSFNALKAWVRRHIRQAATFDDFGGFIAAGLEAISERGARGWFIESGYVVEG